MSSNSYLSFTWIEIKSFIAQYQPLILSFPTEQWMRKRDSLLVIIITAKPILLYPFPNLPWKHYNKTIVTYKYRTLNTQRGRQSKVYYKSFWFLKFATYVQDTEHNGGRLGI